MNKKLTLLLCLKDRSEYTQSWISNNIYEDFEYIIADGSNNDKNLQIFKENSFTNINYIQFPFDKDIKTYISKVISAINNVKTPYIMRVDNDDIIVKDGLEACIKKLENDSHYDIAQANMRGINMKKGDYNNPKYSLVPGIKENFTDLVGYTGLEAIKRGLNPYRQLWYAVYRTNTYRNIWLDIQESKINNIFLIEILQAQCAYIYSKIYYIDKTYYLRLNNPVSSTTLDNQTHDYPNWHNIFFDQEYRDEVKKMGHYVSNKLNCDERLIFDIYRKMYAGMDRKQIRIRKQITLGLSLLLSKLLIFIFPSLNGKKIKSISALFNYLS